MDFGHFGDQIVAILTAIIGVAIIAVIVSNRSNTSNVISSAANAFSEALGTAVSPITGTANAGMGGFTGGLNSSVPQLRLGYGY
ncbi:MAG TPA: hypothetical protein VIY48_00570 [Candidatus Paceibacterota bacterium]